MGDKLIRVMVVGPTTRCDVERIDDDYREYNRLVGGNISGLALPDALREAGFYAFCNDDGVALGLPDNTYAEHLGHAVLKGPAVIFRQRAEYDPEYDGDAQDMSTQEVVRLASYLSSRPTAEAREMAARERKFWDENPSGIRIVTLDEWSNP